MTKYDSTVLVRLVTLTRKYSDFYVYVWDKNTLLTMYNNLHLISFSIKSDMRAERPTVELREGDANGLLD